MRNAEPSAISADYPGHYEHRHSYQLFSVVISARMLSVILFTEDKEAIKVR